MILSLLLTTALAADPNQKWDVSDACTAAERWAYPKAVSEVVDSGTQSLFSDSIATDSTTETRNAALLAISRLGKTTKYSETWAFAQYWLSRLFFHEKQTHVARESFQNFLKIQITSPKRAQALVVQSAAFECLSRIAEQAPTLRISPSVPVEGLKPYLKNLDTARMVMIQDAGLDLIEQHISGQNPLTHARLIAILGLFKSGSSHDRLARGLIAAKDSRIQESLASLQKFVGFEKFTSPFLESKRDLALHLIAEQAYTAKNYDLAVQSSRKISKDSNFVIPAMSTLAWSYQRLGNHSGALGTGYGMMSSAVKNTYAPETPLIMTISFYELCRYSQAYGSLQAFRRDYRTSYQWLRNYFGNTARKTPYQLATQFVHDKNSIPERIGTELVRSVSFLSPQSEINLIRDAQGKAPQLTQASMFPFWVGSIQKQKPVLVAREQELLAMINQGLNKRLKQMLLELDEVGINAEVLEAETLRRAGDDLIWQHLNPEFYEIAKNQKGATTRPKGRFWDFGQRKTQELTKGELWQDELGSYLAESADLCTARKNIGKTASL